MSGEKKRGDFCGPGDEPPDSAVQVTWGDQAVFEP